MYEIYDLLNNVFVNDVDLSTTMGDKIFQGGPNNSESYVTHADSQRAEIFRYIWSRGTKMGFRHHL